MAKTLKGFTLIEILLGLTIFSIISLCVYNVFWMGLKINHRAEQINGSSQKAFNVLNRMAKDLEKSFLYDFSGSYPKECSLKGEKDRLVFLIPTADGIKYVHFYLEKADIKTNHLRPGFFLIRREILLPEEFSPHSSVLPQILMTGLKDEDLRFFYGRFKLDQQKNLKELVWKEYWHDQSLPDAVRIEIRMSGIKNSFKEGVLKRDVYLLSQGLMP